MTDILQEAGSYNEVVNRKKGIALKNLIKKNQLMITALAVMIAIAGYLQFAGKLPAKEASSADVYTENYIAGETSVIGEDTLLDELAGMDSELERVVVEDYLDTEMEGDLLAEAGEAIPEEGEIPGEAVYTSGTAVEILAEAKLLKEQTRAKNKETLLSIINSEGLTDIQKQTAVDCMVQMTAAAEKEAAAEILLEAKGYRDVVVSVNGDAVDVVVNEPVLDEVKRAQIEDIVKRKTEIPAENIIISTIAR